MATIDRDGTKLFYEDAGQGDPSFVFVHGWTCDHTYFAPQFDYFCKDHRVISVDLRGHGQSDKPQEDYSVSRFADDVAWLCGEVGATKPIVVGHSMGGAIVLDLGARYPDLPAAIVMVDAAPIAALLPEQREVISGLVEAMKGPDHLAVRRQMIDGMFLAGSEADLKARVTEQMLSTPKHVAVSAVEQLLLDWDGEAAARALSVPALHIAAERQMNDPAALRTYNPLIVTAQTVGAGHFNQLETPEQVNAMIDRFVLMSLGR
jgi:pimeloyl-ACP methyl ester carboxylesterase